MGLLDQVRRGKELLPPRIVIYGAEKVGKSTFAASAPSPLFIQTEDGCRELDVPRLPPEAPATTYRQVIDCLTAVASEDHEYQTLVIDSIDWLENLVWSHVCANHKPNPVKSIEDVGGGYGKGYGEAVKPWREDILPALDFLNKKKRMAIILIAHAKIAKFADPEGKSYDRYSPKLHERACAVIHEWADCIAFAHKKKFLVKEDVGMGKERMIAAPLGQDGGDRVLITTEQPYCLAGSRYKLPPELPLSWPAFLDAMTAGQAAA